MNCLGLAQGSAPDRLTARRRGESARLGGGSPAFDPATVTLSARVIGEIEGREVEFPPEYDGRYLGRHGGVVEDYRLELLFLEMVFARPLFESSDCGTQAWFEYHAYLGTLRLELRPGHGEAWDVSLPPPKLSQASAEWKERLWVWMGGKPGEHPPIATLPGESILPDALVR